MMTTNTTPRANNGHHRPTCYTPGRHYAIRSLLANYCWRACRTGVNFAGTVAGGKMDKSRDAIVTAGADPRRRTEAEEAEPARAAAAKFMSVPVRQSGGWLVAGSPLSSPSAATGCSLQLLRDNTQRHAWCTSPTFWPSSTAITPPFRFWFAWPRRAALFSFFDLIQYFFVLTSSAVAPNGRRRTEVRCFLPSRPPPSLRRSNIPLRGGEGHHMMYHLPRAAL